MIHIAIYINVILLTQIGFETCFDIAVEGNIWIEEG
jgi:hypothetical protein